MIKASEASVANDTRPLIALSAKSPTLSSSSLPSSSSQSSSLSQSRTDDMKRSSSSSGDVGNTLSASNEVMMDIVDDIKGKEDDEEGENGDGNNNAGEEDPIEEDSIEEMEVENNDEHGKGGRIAPSDSTPNLITSLVIPTTTSSPTPTS